MQNLGPLGNAGKTSQGLGGKMGPPATVNVVKVPVQIGKTTHTTGNQGKVGSMQTAKGLPGPVQSSSVLSINPSSSGGAAGTSFNPKHPSATPLDQVLTRKHLQEMTKEVDPNEQLDDDVEDFLLSYAEDYMEKIIEGACLFAKHRKGTTLEPKDVQTYLERSCNMWAPGFGTDELRPYKRAASAESHKQRIALIKKTVKKY